jgi:hypothetical protein
MSVLSVAPNISRSYEQSGAAPSPNSQRQGRTEDTTSAYMSHSPTPPAAQVGIGHLGSLSPNTTSKVLPLSPTGASDLHYTTGHIADQQNNSSSIQLAGASEVTIQQCDLLKLLLRYLFPRNGEMVEESALLNSLEQVWASHEQGSRLTTEQLTDCHRDVLLDWIMERRKSSELRSMVDRQPSENTLEIVERVLVMNDLRILRLKWKALKLHVSGQDVAPEDLLCSIFAFMTRTEGTEVLFKEGLAGLKETSPEILRP